MEAQSVDYQVLKNITEGFSEDRKLGKGGFGTVYKGVYDSGEEIAVKILHSGLTQSEELFRKELGNMVNLRHENIVRLVGYCYESKSNDFIQINGKWEFVDRVNRALCLEYMHNGSLQDHLSDECAKLDWHTRYRIIKGTCEGLRYLHERPVPILHLDLKPDNILLDKNMVAKIADFGVSKIFVGGQTMVTEYPVGTIRYRPPEFYENKQSPKFDIFSLGVVIIDIVTGPSSYSQIGEISDQQFVDMALEKWGSKLQVKWSGSILEQYYEQVKVCMEIALQCVKKDRKERPDIVSIIDRLIEKETEADQLQNKSLMEKGIPEQMEAPPSPPCSQPANPIRTSQSAQAAIPSSGPNSNDLDLFPQAHPNTSVSADAGNLDALLNMTPFRAMISMVQENPNILQPMLQELGKQNPRILQLIQENQDEFLRLINEPLKGDEDNKMNFLGDHIGDVAEQGHTTAVTPEEYEAILRLEAMGFDRALVLEVFFACNKDEQLAASYLLDHANELDDDGLGKGKL